MPGDVQLTAHEVAPAPLDYVVPKSAVVRIKSVRALFTDNGALVDWLPAVEFISDAGLPGPTASDQGAKITAGGDAAGSFFPGAAKAAAATAASTSAPFAEMDNSGVGPQTVATNTITYMDYAGGLFDTNDAATFALVLDTWGSGVTSLRVKKAGEYLVTVGNSGFALGGGTGWTAANAATSFLSTDVGLNTANAAIPYVWNDPDGSYGFVDQFGAAGFYWTCKAQYTLRVTADMGTRPLLIKLKQLSGRSLDVYASMMIEQTNVTPL